MRVVLVPGFSQTPAMWDEVVAALDRRHVGLALEVPDGLDFAATIAALGAAGGPGVYVGYSMGGRLALSLAVARPSLVRALVLVSASPGIAEPAERAARAESDAALAAELERDGVEVFLERWLAQPLFATLPRSRAQADVRAAGASVARLAHQLVALGQGAMPPMWEELGELPMPVLVVTGTLDARYEAIGAATAARVRDARHVRLVGGHALPLEQPEALAACIEEFLHDVGSTTGPTA